MQPREVAPGVYWVGAIDWNIRDFHGYATYQGTTYNAFLIMDEKITLIDTVKKEKTDEMLARISRVVAPSQIDLVISNHTEMDHSGGLPRLMHRIGESKPIYCSKMGQRNLTSHFREKLNYQPVENQGRISIGRRTLTFLETRMIHWPDSMVTYCPEDGILYSSDAFGQHYAGLERFDDEIGEAIMPHALKYYANILLPFSTLVIKLLGKFREMSLSPRMICPDHGIIWRKDPALIIGKYADWAEQKPGRKVLIVYDTMWHSTEKMAEAIADALDEAHIETKLMHLRSWHRSDVITELTEAGAVLIGSPTLNNGLFPTVADFLSYLKGLRPQNKAAAAFGSYGWSGEAVKLITQELEAMKLKIINPGVKAFFVPDDSGLEACRELGRQAAAALPS
ncbi:MAG: FprA family A-type flavoprotein [Thermodesulfobacteriota bacterium]